MDLSGENEKLKKNTGRFRFLLHARSAWNSNLIPWKLETSGTKINKIEI